MLFNAFPEEIMSRSLAGFDGGVVVHGQEITNLRFADGIALITKSEAELEEITRRLDDTSRKFGMEISAEKSKLLVISSRPTKIEADIEIDNVKLEQVINSNISGLQLTRMASRRTN